MTGPQGGALGIAELVADLRARLSSGGVDDADVSARRILEAATGLGGAELAVTAEKATRRMVAAADRMLARRLAGEPLQYVVGAWGFRRLDLAVDARALIPRPETEELVGHVLDWLADAGAVAPRVADLGTGTGAIALSLVVEHPTVEVWATDVSGAALELARANLAGTGRPASRVRLAEGSWFDALDPALAGTLDAIVANPPYVPSGERLDPVVADWEPEIALRSGADGLDALAEIMSGAGRWLRAGGRVFVEHGADQGAAVREAARRAGLGAATTATDLAGRDRFTMTAGAAEIDPAQIDAAEAALRAGGVVVAATDTVPGLVARAEDADGVAAVFAAKGRPATEPLPVFVADLAQAEQLVDLGPVGARLAARHWPGPLTIVAPARAPLPAAAGRDTLGVRVPDAAALRELARRVGPLTGTSANPHGESTAPTAAAAAASVGHTGPTVEGPAASGPPSTVVDVSSGTPVVLREGAVAAGDLQDGP